MSYKKFVKDISILGLMQIITAIAGIVTLPIITKFLGVKNYGIWTQLTVTLSLIAPIAMLNLPYTLVRFLALEKNKEETQDGIWTALVLIFATSTVISLFLLFFSNSISSFFGCAEILIKVLAFTIIFQYPSMVFFAILRAFQEIKKYCFIIILQNFLQTTFIIIAIYLGYGLFGAMISILLVNFITFLLTIFLIIQKFGVKFPKFLKIKEYVSFGLPTILGDISFWIIQSSDNYLIGYFLGTLYVGYYAPAYNLGGFVAFFIAPLGFILPAILSKSYDENRIDEVKIYLRYSIKYFLLIGTPALFGLSILSKQLLTIFSTPEIAQRSYTIVPFVALSMVFFGVSIIIGQIINLKKKTKISGIAWSVAAIFNLILNLLFIPLLGILGAAITTFLAYTLALVLIWYYSFKELPFEIDWKTVLKGILASTLMALFIFWLNPIGFYKTVIGIILGVLIYGILIFLLKCFNEKEINLFKGYFFKT